MSLATTSASDIPCNEDDEDLNCSVNKVCVMSSNNAANECSGVSMRLSTSVSNTVDLLKVRGQQNTCDLTLKALPVSGETYKLNCLVDLSTRIQPSICGRRSRQLSAIFPSLVC